MSLTEVLHKIGSKLPHPSEAVREELHADIAELEETLEADLRELVQQVLADERSLQTPAPAPLAPDADTDLGPATEPTEPTVAGA